MKKIGNREFYVTVENKHTCDIDYYVHDCGVIWSKNPERPVFDIYFHIIEHACKLGEALRRELYDMAVSELGRTAMWLFGFINKLKNSTKGNDKLFTSKRELYEMLLNKFPNCCPTCFRNEIAIPIKNGIKNESWLDIWKGEIRPCTCLLRPLDVEIRNQKSKKEDKIYTNEDITIEELK